MQSKAVNIFWYLVLFIVLSFNVYLRLMPQNFPQLRQAAEFLTEQDITSNVTKQVKQKNPDLNPYIQQKIIAEIKEKRLDSQSNFTLSVNAKFDELVDTYKDDKGRTYLQELDPYHWYRYTKLVVENGFPGDRIKDGQVYDDYMLAPVGFGVTRHRLLFYLTAYLYKAYSYFDTSIDLMTFVFYFPVFLSVFWLLVLFLTTRCFFSLPTAVVTTLLAGGARVVILRGAAGWYDMDILSIIFPVLIFAMFAKSLSAKKNRIFVFSAFAGVLSALYAFTWMGWIQTFLVVLGYFVYKSLNDISLYSTDKDILKKKMISNISAVLFYYIFTAIFTYLFIGQEPLSVFLNVLKTYFGLGKSFSLSIWPNTLFTVGELRKGDFDSMARALYGGLFFVFGIFSMLVVYIKSKRTKAADFFVPLIFTFMLMIYASFKGIRFALFLVSPWAIFTAEALVIIFNSIYPRILSFEKRRKYPSLMLAAFIIALLIQVVVYRALEVSKKVFPMIRDNMYEAQEYIRDNTEENAIINSWWDFGDWYKVIADRAVSFDGQSQTTPVSYWMAKLLYAADSNEANNILRMLNNSSYNLFDIIYNEVDDSFASIAILQKLITLDHDSAKEFLDQTRLSQKAKSDLLESIYVLKPRPAYFVVDASMFQKTSEISFLANWNHAKLFLKENINKDPKELIAETSALFGLKPNKVHMMYTELLMAETGNEKNEVLSKRQTFIANMSDGSLENDKLFFDNGLFLDLDNFEIKFHTRKMGYKTPRFLAYYDGQDYKFFEYDKDDSVEEDELLEKVGFIVYKEGDDWKTIGASDRELASSLFVRLYCMNAYGFNGFEMFYENVDAGMKVYKINWNYKEDQLDV